MRFEGLLHDHPQWPIVHERRSTADHGVRDASHRIEITPVVHARPHRLLRSHVLGCAENDAGASQLLLSALADRFRDAEVQQLDLRGLCLAYEEDVLGFDVPMDDLLGMGDLEGVQDTEQHGAGLSE